MTLRLSSLAPLAFVLFVAGCGTSGSGSDANSPSGGGGGTSGSAPSCSMLDACMLATSADVSTDFGAMYGDGTHGVQDHAGTDSTASVSTCSFDPGATTAPRVELLVRCSPFHDNDVASTKMEAVTMGYTPPVDVSGVGDAAFWTTRMVASATNGQLEVFVGTDLLLIVTVGSTTDANAALESAKKLAATALSRK